MRNNGFSLIEAALTLLMLGGLAGVMINSSFWQNKQDPSLEVGRAMLAQSIFERYMSDPERIKSLYSKKELVLGAEDIPSETNARGTLALSKTPDADLLEMRLTLEFAGREPLRLVTLVDGRPEASGTDLDLGKNLDLHTDLTLGSSSSRP